MGGGGLLVKAIELKDRLNLILQTQLKPFVDCRHGMSPALVFSCCCITHTQFWRVNFITSLQIVVPVSSKEHLFKVFLLSLHYMVFHVCYWAVRSAAERLWYWCFDIKTRVVLISFVPLLRYRYCKNWNVQEHAKCRNNKENDRRIWWGMVYRYYTVLLVYILQIIYKHQITLSVMKYVTVCFGCKPEMQQARNQW